MRVGEGSDEDDEEAFYTAGSAGGRSRPRAHGGPGDRPVRGDDRLVGKTLTLKQCHEMSIQRCYACQGYGHVSRDCANRAGVKINIETGVSLLGDAQRAASGHSAARPRAADGSAARSDHEGDFDDEALFVADDYESDFGGSGFVCDAFACGVCDTPLAAAAAAAPRVARHGFLDQIKQLFCLEGAFA